MNFAKLCDIVAKLRAPGGCPWDREQTNESLLPALIEEAYEVTEAARVQDDTHFREELGDLLLLVVMHAEIAAEAGRFNIERVIGEVSEKLVRRHPHVFGTSDAPRLRSSPQTMGSNQARREKGRFALPGKFTKSIARAGARAKGAIQSGQSEF